MNKTLLTIIIVIVVLLGAWYLFSANEDVLAPELNENTISEEGNNVSENTDEEGGEIDSNTPAVKEFTLTGSNFRFSESEIRVKKGDIVKVTFVNTVGTHDWRLDGYNMGTSVLQAGDRETVEFVADKTGSFEYYCSVGSHRAMGMKGTLIVE